MEVDHHLLQAASVQRRALYALLMREVISRFGRENLGVMWMIAEPMMFTLGVATLWSAYRLGHGSAMPIVSFAITGYSSVLLWRNCASRAAGAVELNRSLLYHRGVRVIDTLLTRILVEVIGATASFVLLVALFSYFEWMPGPKDLFVVVTAWLLLAWLGAAIALVIGAAGTLSPVVERLWHPVSYLLFPMSGAAFMVDWLPANLRSIVLVMPMVHGVELLRHGYFGNVVPPHYDVPYLAECSLGITLVGLLCVRAVNSRVSVG